MGFLGFRVGSGVWDDSQDDATLAPFPDQDDLSEERVLRFLLGNASPRVGNSSPYTPEDGQYSSEEQSSTREILASFGDSGTTASVGTYGNILQISKYLGAGRTGFFCVNNAFTMSPWWIGYRAHDLQRLAQNDTRDGIGAFGLKMNFKENITAPSLTFVHDRWPRFNITSPEIMMTLQYFIHEGTLIQQFDVEMKGTPASGRDFDLYLDASLKIRDLEFVDAEYHFNEDLNCSKCHSKSLGPFGYSVVLGHRIEHPEDSQDIPKAYTEGDERINDNKRRPEASLEANRDSPDERKILPEKSGRENMSNDTPESVALIMAMFFNGKPQKIAKEGKLAVSKEDILDSNGRGRITMAYRLQLMLTQSMEWESSLIRTSVCHIDDVLRASKYESFDLTENNQSNLNFVMKRNMEHILSVCAIPISNKPIGLDPASPSIPETRTEKRIALTCGDLSGHRISTSASFFAIQFLLSVNEILKKKYAENIYSQQLQDRIYETCRNHLRWVFKSLARDEDGRLFPSYWPNGKEIQGYRGVTSNQATECPFQIIKAADFNRVFKIDSEDRSAVESLIKAWVSILKKEDKRGCFAWPRSKDTDIAFFRLDDHIWIWKALKAVEDLGLSIDLKPNLQRDGQVSIQKSFSSEAQRAMIKRFTIEDPVTRRRMLAVSRSIRESRFLLHSRDTAIFYGMDWGFFASGSSGLNLWNNTVGIQMYHDNNNDEQWENPLRYALAIVLATKGQRINLKSPSEMLSHAKNVLLDNASSTGLFPGRLDGTTKRPRLFEDEVSRDSHYHVMFETAYVMLKYGQMEAPTGGHKSNGKQSFGLQSPAKHLVQINSPEHRVQSSQPDSNAHTTFGAEQQNARYHSEETFQIASQTAQSEALVMKKRIPFNHLIDQKSILEFPDEWLYSYPDFLDFEPTFELGSFDDFLKHLKSMRDSSQSGGLIRDGIDSFLDISYRHPVLLDKDLATLDWNLLDLRGIDYALLIDVAKKSRKTKLQSREYWDHENISQCCNGYIQRLAQGRTTQKAKKRLLHLTRVSKASAMLTVVFSPDSEKESLCAFFERHGKYENYFFDDTMAVLNTWETEVHLSFYRLLNENRTRHKPTPHDIPTPVSRQLPDGKKREMDLVSLGYRFRGDFFDRYWTCHFVEYNLVEKWRLNDKNSNPEPETSAWQQRKVLELMLFDWMLTRLVDETDTLVEAIRRELENHRDKLTGSNINSNNYSNSYRQWRRYQPILQAIEERLVAALRITKRWSSREADRGQERPRWTRNDERKYRRALNKLSISIKRRIREAESHQANLESLRISVVSMLDSVRNELAFNSSENIRYFTYITIAFLPLGFSASIFSMNGAPNHETVISMIVTTTIAFLLTFISAIVFQNTRPQRDTAKGSISNTRRRAWKSIKDLVKNSQQNSEAKGQVEEDDKAMSRETCDPIRGGDSSSLGNNRTLSSKSTGNNIADEPKPRRLPLRQRILQRLFSGNQQNNESLEHSQTV